MSDPAGARRLLPIPDNRAPAWAPFEHAQDLVAPLQRQRFTIRGEREETPDPRFIAHRCGFDSQMILHMAQEEAKAAEGDPSLNGISFCTAKRQPSPQEVVIRLRASGIGGHACLVHSKAGVLCRGAAVPKVFQKSMV